MKVGILTTQLGTNNGQWMLTHCIQLGIHWLGHH